MQKVKWNKIGTFLVIAILMLNSWLPWSTVLAADEGNSDIEWNASVNVSSNKTWAITFNSFLDLSTVTNENIYVKNKLGHTIHTDISIGKANNEIVIQPPEGGYLEGETYSLHITADVKDEQGNPLKKSVNKTFMIEREEAASIERLESAIVLPEEGVVLGGDSDNDEAGESGEELRISTETAEDLQVGDVVIIEPNATFPEGIARKIEQMSEENGEVILSTSVPFINEVLKELDLNQSIAINASHIIPDSLAREVTVSDYKEYDVQSASFFEGLQFTLSDFPLIIENQKMLVSGTIKLENPVLNPYLKLSKSKTSLEELKFTFSTTIITKLSFNAEGSIKLGKPIQFKEVEVNMGKLSVPVPQIPGFTIGGGFSGVIKTAAIGEYHASISNTTFVEVGVIKKQDSFEPIRTMNNQTDISQSGQGGLETKVGFRAALDGSYLKIKVIKLANDVGVYGNMKLVKGQLISNNNQIRYCSSGEVGVFHDIGLTFPSFPYPFNKSWSLHGYKLPAAFLSNCETLQSIKFNTSEIDIESGSTKPIEVTATIFDFSLGESLIKNVTSKTTYETSDPSVTVASNGRIRVDDLQSDKKVTITASYNDGNSIEQAKLLVNVKKDPMIPDLPTGDAMVTVPYEVNYELTNNTNSTKSLSLKDAVDYVAYNSSGRIVSQSKASRYIYIPANSVAIISFNKQLSEPIQVPDGVTIKPTDEEAYTTIYQQGKTTSEWMNKSNGSVLLRVEKSIYDYVVYDSRNRIYTFNHNNNNGAALYIPAGGKAKITSLSNLVNASAPSRHISVTIADIPALVKQEIRAGETYSFTNNQAFDNTIKLSGAGTYDYATYRKNGSSRTYYKNQAAGVYPSTLYTWSGEKTIITNTGVQSLTVYVPTNLFSVTQEQDETLSTLIIGAGETYSFTNNQAFDNTIKLTGAGTYDYATYRKNGSSRTYYKNQAAGVYPSTLYTWTGEKTTITNTGAQSLTVYVPTNLFSVTQEQEETLSTLIIGAGETYSFTNNQAFDNTIKLTGAGTYDYATYRKNGSSRTYYKNQAAGVYPSTLYTWSGEKTIITNTGAQSLTVYVPTNLFSVTQEQDETLSTFIIGAGETYSFTNNQAFDNTIKLTGAGTYDYATYRKNGDLRGHYKNQLAGAYSSTLYTWSGEKTIVTNTGALPLIAYVPTKILNVTEGGIIELTDYQKEIGEIIVSVIDATSVKVIFDIEIEELGKEYVTVFNTNNAEEKYVQDIVLLEDRKSVIINFQEPLTSKVTYSLAIQDGETVRSSEFEYVGEKVVKVEAADMTVPAGVVTEINYQVFDENGLDITSTISVVIRATEGIVENDDKTINLAAGEAFVTIVAIDENGIVMGSQHITVTAQVNEEN